MINQQTGLGVLKQGRSGTCSQRGSNLKGTAELEDKKMPPGVFQREGLKQSVQDNEIHRGRFGPSVKL